MKRIGSALLAVVLAVGMTACEGDTPARPTPVVEKFEIAQSRLFVDRPHGDGAFVIPDQLVSFDASFVIRGATKPVKAAVFFRAESGTETYENQTLVYGPFSGRETTLTVSFRIRDGLLAYAQGRPGQAIGVFVRFLVDGKSVAEFNQFKFYLR